MERILIVDDDITFGLMLKTWLSKKGFGTQTAASAAAARTALAEGGFSLVLSDMRLPDEDGIALLQWMSGQRIEVPVIVMTSYAEIQNAVRCMKLGARDYVAKPVNPDELLKKIREALDAPAPVGDVPPVTPEKAPETSRAAGGDIPNYIEGQSDAARQLYEYVRLVDEHVGLGERRQRHGQGTCGAADPPPEQARRKAVRGGRLRRHSARPGCFGVLRPCQGVVHGGCRR
jgi:two-component system response regulator HydG